MSGEFTPLEETRAYKELVAKGVAIGRQEGRWREARRLVLLQLQRRIAVLSVEQLESLGAALLDFRDPSELDVWLADH